MCVAETDAEGGPEKLAGCDAADCAAADEAVARGDCEGDSVLTTGGSPAKMVKKPQRMRKVYRRRLPRQAYGVILAPTLVFGRLQSAARCNVYEVQWASSSRRLK